MSRKKILLAVLILSIASFTSCDQKEMEEEQLETKNIPTETEAADYREPHQYGGWYCPDNFGGFPPVDIQDLESVPVVADRLPTEEETRDGRSLIYIDMSKYPDARPLEMDLPRVGRIYSEHNGINELIIVIQAVVIGADTIVGYRFPNGGNGSAWLGQVTFLSDEEVDEEGATPFVYIKEEIEASREEIWKAITTTPYAKELGERFDKQTFFGSVWTEGASAHLSDDSNGKKARGMVADMWGNLYLHIDYDTEGEHRAEKILIAPSQEGETTELYIVAGPYPDGLEMQEEKWMSWFKEVKEVSEGE